uniref:Secreted protein n=1 Tax=Myotis myotis TaxID=51298 RepID=A0A7J7ZYJ9_MYOMY|nr:hypothetical protein mMyoMyo1_009829 [Myotis myotis]
MVLFLCFYVPVVLLCCRIYHMSLSSLSPSLLSNNEMLRIVTVSASVTLLDTSYAFEHITLKSDFCKSGAENADGPCAFSQTDRRNSRIEQHPPRIGELNTAGEAIHGQKGQRSPRERRERELRNQTP